MFKGGMGSVSGGTGAGSFTASSGSSSSSSSSSSASVATTGLGVQAPVGFWDPLGLSKGADAATMKRRRAVEIKHGRVAMYATMGYIVPEYYKFPGRAVLLRTAEVVADAVAAEHETHRKHERSCSVVAVRIPQPQLGLEVL